MKTLSSGLIVISPQGWLLAHATHTSRWDLPKGGVDQGETPQQAAIRETFEETNLDVRPWASHMQDLGRHLYIPNKDLHLFVLRIDQAWDLSECRCHTFVEKEKYRFPETDRWEWVPETQVLQRIGKGLGNLLMQVGLLPLDPCWWEKRLEQDKAYLAHQRGLGTTKKRA